MGVSISDILSGGVDKIVDSVGNAIDKLVTSDEERLQLRNALMEAKLDAMQKSEKNWLEHEKEITNRWLSDNEHPLTRLVRPTVVVWSVTLFTAAMIADGNIGGFVIKEAYLPILQSIVMMVIGAYFGGRSYEKGQRYVATKISDEVKNGQ